MTVIARTPDLGLVLRLQRPGVSSADCVPAIGQAGWWDPQTQGYTAQIAHGSTSYLGERIVWWAQVNGQLCGGEVTWELHWDGAGEGGGPLAVPVGPALYVCILSDADGLHVAYPTAGVLTATPTVHLGKQAFPVAPITLIIAAQYN